MADRPAYDPSTDDHHQQSPTPTPQHYDGGTTIAAGHGTVPPASTFNPPNVPGGSGNPGSGTSVDTPSMLLFADNIDKLIQPTRDAASVLQKVQVEPGAFYHANQIRTKVNGPNADAGLKEQYIKVFQDLAQGLGDLRDGVKALAQQYTTLEDAGRMKATDLQNAMQTTTSDFTSLVTDAGGSGGGAS
ncbi:MULTISPECIES: hypothetical protein [Streptomyces]|uniref:Type VII secretion system-associated protein n=1 Tax=Streptomyces gibsoniae TaxID=3075529 RepID=A0ABU2TUA3_9ACTN|nr:hypothetical protein [Streptomyces sp. DSM 41699]MDT0464427.1 hypothetical protein [Streptomyces sp. DSM 41699]